MDFFSLKFLIFFLSSIIVFYSSPVAMRAKIILPALNIIFILFYVQSITQLIPFVLFLSMGFLAIRTVGLFPRKGIFIAFLSIILVIFIYLKKYAYVSFFHFIGWPYLTVGLSYVLFRIVQILIDVYQKEINERVSFASYFNFCCNFFTFISGPIQRYQEYKQQESSLGQKTLSDDEVFDCFSRMVNGFFKVIVLSTLFLIYHKYEAIGLREMIFEGSSFSACRKFILAAFLYLLYLYFNFSGYTDIVISFGKLFGFQLPENFNRPFASRSFIELWSRWHMTLSQWFKFYFFNPLVKFFYYKWPDPKMVPYQGVMAFLLTFFVIGIWHGSSWKFVVYGLFLGGGVSFNKLFDVLMRKYFRKGYKKFTDHDFSGLLGQTLTFTYFSLANICFWFDSKDLFQLIAKWKITGFLKSFLIGTIISMIAVFIARNLKNVFNPVYCWGIGLLKNYYFARTWVALLMFIVIAFWFYGGTSIPEFLYKAF